MLVEEKNGKIFIEDYENIQELYAELDKMHEEYLSGKGKNYTMEEVWDIFKNRKNTFLTSN